MPRARAEKKKSSLSSRRPRKASARRVTGGAATAGGMNFQATVTAIAMVSMVRGIPLGWLDGIAQDIPVEVLTETGGSGDDLRIRFHDGTVGEAQIKRGLAAGARLWDPLLSLSKAIHQGAIRYGLLIVSPDSSQTIQRTLARDIGRLGDGRTDDLGELATRLVSKLTADGVPIATVCSRLRIVTANAVDMNQASIQAACAELAHVCKRDGQIGDAWNRLYRDATQLIELRGARTSSKVIRILRSAGIEIRDDGQESPGTFLAKLNKWVFASNMTFSIFGVSQAPSIDTAWIPLTAAVRDDNRIQPTDLAETLKQYHDWHKRYPSQDSKTIDCETIGRFVRHVVVIAGPGMGKSTLLTKLARLYSGDGIPVLRVSLSAIAAQMKYRGIGWSTALFDLGLDGSGLPAAMAARAGIADWMLLCDGLDECAGDQEKVAQGLLSFVAGHPGCRAIVTTRPIGYRTGLLGSWRHYEVAPLDNNSADANLANLISSIVPDTNALHDNAWTTAHAQLKASKADPLISRSPFLLSIAASLIVRGSNLGRTKTELYAKIFQLIEDAAKSRDPERPATTSILLRFLDTLGWTLIAHPLDQINEIVGHCADGLAPELGYTPLQARELAEKCLLYWQAVGMLERVHHAGEETVTFLHKTLGEFAAARFLAAMSLAEQSAAIVATIGEPEWSEVIDFAGSLGLATQMCATLLENHTRGPTGLRAIERALAIAAEADVPPDASVRQQLINFAFEYVRSERKSWAYSIGELIGDVAKRFPTEVAPHTTSLLASEQTWTRAVAWTCAVLAGPAHYDLNSLIEQFNRLPGIIEHGIWQSLGGGVSLGGGNFGMLQHFIVPAVEAILEQCSEEIADEILPRVLTSDMQTVHTHTEISELLKARGKTYTIKGSSSLYDWSAAMRGPEGYAAAQRTSFEAILGTIAEFGTPMVVGLSGIGSSKPLLHLSALLRQTNFMEMPVADVWGWQERYNKEAVRDVLRSVLDVVPLERDQLIADAHDALSSLQVLSDENLFSLYRILPKVDADEIDWDRAATLTLDPIRLEPALYHKSRWIIQLAVNLSANMVRGAALQELATRLLADGKGLTLWAGSALAVLAEKSIATAILCARLEKPLVAGCDHVMRALRKLSPEPTPEALSAVTNGLMNGNASTATAAAELAADWARPDAGDLIELLENSYQFWLKHEEPSPTKNGVVPNSPREKILAALQLMRNATTVQLFGYASDSRSDVSTIGREALLRHLKVSEEGCKMLLSGIEAGKISPSLLSGALRARIPLELDQVQKVCDFLVAAEPKLRWAALSILDDAYLPSDKIDQLARERTFDTNLDVREAAFRVLDSRATTNKLR